VGPMTTAGTTQTFTYALSGADPACSSGAASGVSNSCGIHIHVGMSCTADAGGHYYAGAVTSDPWTSISYTSAADGSSSGTESVDTGGESADVAGRTMIIHDHTGARVACAILGAVTQARGMNSGGSGGLSAGAIVGIVLGSVAFVLLVGIGAFYVIGGPEMFDKPPPPPSTTPSGVVLSAGGGAV